MPKVKIEYHSIQSDHILAFPEFDHSEVVEYETPRKLQRYIESKKDDWGNYYKKPDKKKSFGFDYVSRTGGVKVKPYKPTKIKKI